MSPTIETTRLIQANETLPCQNCGQIGGEPREWVDEDPSVGYRAKEHGCSLCTPAARPVAMPDVRPGDIFYMARPDLPMVGYVTESNMFGCRFTCLKIGQNLGLFGVEVNQPLPWEYLRDEGAVFLRVAKPAIVEDDGQDVEF